MSKTIAAIYAVSENGVIGKNGDLPWHLPKDFAFFKQKTLGNPIIMGRKSYESLGKPLPKRRNIVVSRNPSFRIPGVEVVNSIKAAIDLCQEEKLIFITGGSNIYKESIEQGFVNLIYETIVHAEVEGDVLFELTNRENWQIIKSEFHAADEKNRYDFTFRTMIRKT